MIEVTGRATTVNAKALDVPFEVVTVTVRLPNAAVDRTVIVIGKLAARPPPQIAAVTPVPLKVTAVAPTKLVPVIVAGKLLPVRPAGGAIVVSVGRPGTVPPPAWVIIS